MQDSPGDVLNEAGVSSLLRRRDQSLLAWLALIAGAGVFLCECPMAGAFQGSVQWEHLPQRKAPFAVNVNTAAWPEMTQLPEIGETLARRIVENRRLEGPFQTPDDLTRVHGIGEKMLASMRPYLDPESWRQGRYGGER